MLLQKTFRPIVREMPESGNRVTTETISHINWCVRNSDKDLLTSRFILNNEDKYLKNKNQFSDELNNLIIYRNYKDFIILFRLQKAFLLPWIFHDLYIKVAFFQKIWWSSKKYAKSLSSTWFFEISFLFLFCSWFLG